MRVLAIAAILATSLGVVRAETIPNANEIRSEIDRLIADRVADKQPATLGLMRDVIDKTITYGVAAFNAGDHAACQAFYRTTITSLTKAFSGPGGTSEFAVRPLHDLAAAAERARGYLDVDRQAWSLRFGFDQVNLACAIDIGIAQVQVQTGNQYFSRGEYDEAEIAYARARDMVTELSGIELNATPVNARIGGVLHAQTLLMLDRAPDAAREMAKVILRVPELAGAKFDLHALSINHAETEKALSAAEAASLKDPTDANLAFLLAVEQRYGGKPEESVATLASVLKLAPNHAAAHLLASPPPAAAPTPGAGHGAAPGAGGDGGEVVP